MPVRILLTNVRLGTTALLMAIQMSVQGEVGDGDRFLGIKQDFVKLLVQSLCKYPYLMICR
jgi:hypothetical protein